MAGTPRKEGGVQVKVISRKSTQAAKPTTALGTSGGGRTNQTESNVHTGVCEELLRKEE